jgi:hypothetical protein
MKVTIKSTKQTATIASERKCFNETTYHLIDANGATIWNGNMMYFAQSQIQF